MSFRSSGRFRRRKNSTWVRPIPDPSEVTEGPAAFPKQLPRSPADNLHMTLPRPVYEGDVVHIQRRIIDGQLLLRPDPEVLELVRYAVAAAAERCGIVLHSCCVIANHVHLLATDPEGRHPEFTAHMNRTIALGLHRLHDLHGTIWEPGGPSVQRMEGAEAMLEAIGYIHANPIAAGYVHDERLYPGLFGIDERAPLKRSTERIRRPACFGPDSALPEEVELKIETVAQLVEERGAERAANDIALAIRRHREKAQRERADSGLPYLGIKRLLEEKITKRAKRPKRAGFSPTFKGVVGGAIRRASETLRAFRSAYAEALAQLREGVRDVVFPYGTYYLRRYAGVATLPSG